jgi:glutamyl-tRNA synthetase
MSVRVRFAPSPTGALHIGGVRTALFNYLFARGRGGVFILRIEDTDQNRYVPGAEDYIVEALRWFGLQPDEGVTNGGPYGPYRQSDRKALYPEYARQLVRNGKAYYAFDTPDELEARRQAEENFTYNHLTRDGLVNSLTLPAAEVEARLAAGEHFVVRLLVEPGREIVIQDRIRGEVRFQSSELDDKVLLKADGMPTYHLANVVDDRLMKITHVIRGEEWLPSTAHHALLYEGFGWQDAMPEFAHLPLILKPIGNGKLSKRDGAKFGIPVFPLSWKGEGPEDSFTGVRETGFLPEAALNFLALLGWRPETEQEMFTIKEMIELFSLDQISKSGARFDYEKAKWFNQQYIKNAPNATLAPLVRPYIAQQGYTPDDQTLENIIGLMKERVTFLPDFATEAYYLFEPVKHYDAETLQKKWKPELQPAFEALMETMQRAHADNAAALEADVKHFMQEQGFKPGDLLPLLRIAMAGTMKGPAVFDMAILLGKAETYRRLQKALAYFVQFHIDLK